MKRKLLLAMIWVALLLASGTLSYAGPGSEDGEDLTEGAKAVSCSILDEAGTPITTANAGDVVQLRISHASVANPTRQFIFRVPSTDPAYTDTFMYVKKYTGTSSGGIIYMKIQPYTYVGGTGVFIGNVPGQGACYATLTIP